MIVQKYNYLKLNRNTTAGTRHYTTPGGNVVPSVTTVLDKTKPAADKKVLDDWRKRTRDHKHITKKAANVGTIMHRKLEEYIKGTLKAPGGNLGQQYGHNMAQTVIAEGLQNVDEVWGVEISLYNSQLYAGTTDCAGVWKRNESIIDFKQTNRPKKREWIDDYFLQLTAYGDAHNVMFGTDIRTGVIMMCSNPESVDPLKYQEFVLEGKEWDKYHGMWFDRLEEYYRKHG